MDLFIVQLSPQELEIVIGGLGKLPAEISFDLIVKIRTLQKQQIDQQKSAEQSEPEKVVSE